MKTIYLARHAGSERSESDDGDDEPLASAHRRAHVLADRLHRERPRPSIVLCSSAAEARETCAAIWGQLLSAASIVMDEGLEDANSGELLARLQSLADDIDVVLVIGHNPGIHDLAVRLVGDGDDIDLAVLRSRLPNGGLVKMSTGSSWINLWPGTALLERVEV